MATVSQEGVNTLMSQINNEAQNISATIRTGGTNMLKELGQVWACPYAMDFAAQFNDKMTKISQAFRSNMTEFQNSVNGNVSNYNLMNQTSVSVPSVSYDDPVIDTSGVMEQLADGRQGIIEGTDTSVLNALDRAIQEMNTSVTNATNNANSSGAFDSDELSAVAGYYGAIGNALTEANQTLTESAKNFISQTIEQYGELKRQNIQNVTVE